MGAALVPVGLSRQLASYFSQVPPYALDSVVTATMQAAAAQPALRGAAPPGSRPQDARAGRGAQAAQGGGARRRSLPGARSEGAAQVAAREDGRRRDG